MTPLRLLSIVLFLTAPVMIPCALAEETVKDYYERGFQLISEKKLDEALESFQKAAELAPDLPQIYYAMGLIHFEKKENVYDAIDAFERALSLKPDMPEPNYHLGIIYGGLVPDFEKSEYHFGEAIKASPGYAPAYFGLGWTKLTRQKDSQGAVPYLEKASELNPDHTEALYYLGLSHILNGESHRALKPISLLKMQGNENLSRALEAMVDVDPAVVKQRVFGGWEGGDPAEAPAVEQQPAAQEAPAQALPEFLFS